MKLDHIVILLSRLDRQIAFYDTLLPLLGFNKTLGHVYGNGQGIYLDFRQAEKARHEYQRLAPGLNHIGFSAPSAQAVEHIQKCMRQAGFQAPDIQTFGDAIALFMKDDDGMRIEVGWEP